MTPIAWVAANLVIAVGSVLQGTIGFGLALFSAPLLALINPALAPGPLLVCNVALTGLMARREWGEVAVDEVGYALGGRLVGIGIAVWVMGLLSARGIDILFGAIVLVAVLMVAAGLSFRLNAGTLIGAGVVSGVMGTATAIGGPPMAIVYQREKGPKLRGTLSLYFTIGAVLSAIGLALKGRFGVPDIWIGLWLCPGVVIGYAGSHRFLPLIDRKGIRPAVLILSGLSAIFLILRQVL